MAEREGALWLCIRAGVKQFEARRDDPDPRRPVVSIHAVLDTFRKQSRSIVIYVFFGIIIAVFIINFGPQSQGCTVTDSFAASVRGRTLTDSDFRYGLVLSGAARMAPAEAKVRRIREFVMDHLIEREILAAEAEKAGLRVADKEVQDLLVSGAVIALGRRTEVFKGWFLNDDVFDYERFRKFCLHEIGLTERRFIEHQRRELLAEKMRDLVRRSARVSEEEVVSDFAARQLQVDLEYVRFAGRKFAAGADVRPDEIDAFVTKSREKIKERYHTRKFLYTKLPREVRARVMRLRATGKADAVKAKARADALAARVRGGEDFAALARAESDDAGMRARGGDLGWRRRGATGMGDAVEKLLFEAKPGDVIGPVESGPAWVVARVERVREGDQSLEAVERDLAEEMLREERGAGSARKRAEDLLARVRAGEKWEDLFPEAPDKDPDQDPDKGGDEKADEGGEKPAAPATREEEGKGPPPEFARRATGSFPRRGEVIPGIGVSKELMRDAFKLTSDRPLAERAYEVAGSVYLVRLKSRQDPDVEAMQAQKALIVQSSAALKAEQMLAEMSAALCRDAKPRVNAALVSYDDEEGGYQPCSMLGAR